MIDRSGYVAASEPPSDAYRNGYKSYQISLSEGISILNPFDKQTDHTNHKLWIKGWYDAEEQYLKGN